MRGIFIGLGLGLGLGLGFGLGLAPVAAGTASAQTKEQIDLCYSSTATAEQTIDGCTAMIKSGRYSGTELSHAFNNRSTGYSDKGQLDSAIADQTQAIKIDPTNAQAYNNRCQDQSKTGLYDQAIPDCTRALALKPDYANAYANRGYAYLFNETILQADEGCDFDFMRREGK